MREHLVVGTDGADKARVLVHRDHETLGSITTNIILANRNICIALSTHYSKAHTLHH